MTTQTDVATEVSVMPAGDLIARLGVACMAAAILSGVGKGIWELARPVLSDPQSLASTPPAQLWVYCGLEVVKSAGFLAGLFGFYLCATKRGLVTKGFMVLAVAGGTFFAAVWMWIAATAHFTIIYVLGGMWYQMVAPAALGVAALFARRVAWWKGALAVVLGVTNAQIFPLLGPARALLVQGVIWLVFGCVVFSLRRGARA